ncbi:hydrolases of the alpha/beta superfamily [Halorhodospira halochloris]|uniref:Hydrolases of the alpha/beta superfamily n=1 Tax=Halorhodospira halochloris TaxID=1052 RepID=A0A110B5S4_HALHR|nr:alpha/beta hydrolase [Halorhodospira halochloris]BAU58796.2 hydrolases of the alpha/beta superfamily [Halorhodospira halochloris]
MSGCQRAFFFPSEEHYWDPKEEGVEYEDVFFKSSDGVKLHGWFLPAQGDETFGTIIHLHGNAQNISTHLVSVWWLPKHGFNVFVFDYRGFGHSEGRPDFSGVHKDAHAALETVINDMEKDPETLLVFGQSIGASIAITSLSLWEGEEPAGLVAETPFACYRQITREVLGSFWLTWPFQYPFSWLVTDAYSPIDFIHDLQMPVLLIAAEKDRTTPPHHAESLYEAASPPRHIWHIEGARHGLPMADSRVRKHLLDTFHGWLEGDLDAAEKAPADPWQQDPPRP